MSEQATEPPPLIAPVERPAAAARVAIGLVALGLLEGVSEIVSIIAAFKAVEHGASAHISFPFGFAAFWFAAWLVWQDKRVIWPILGYLAALGLGSLIGGGLAAVIEFPANLVKAYARNEPAWFGYYAGYFSLSAIFFAWLIIEARRVDWRPAFPKPHSRWLQPGAFAAYSAVFTAVFLGTILALLNGPWTEPIIERAQRVSGKGYDGYQVINYHFRTANGHTTNSAVVIAYSDKEFKTIQLNWEN